MKQFDTIFDPILKDPRWLAKREEIFKRDNHHCLYCNAEANLEVHHIYYIIKKQPWEYPNNLLVTFCRDCHKHWHDLYGIEYCTEKGMPLTLFLKGPCRWLENNSSRYVIPFELRDDEGNVVYYGETATWELDNILIDRFGTPLNYNLSHKQNGAWLVPNPACDGYRFKKDIFNQLNLKI
jgi:hypothetical protein